MRSYLAEMGNRHSTLCRRLGGLMKNAVDAEDVVQDAYVRMLEVDAEGTEIRSPNSYINRISRNIAIDRLRRRQRADRIFVSSEEAEHINFQWLNAASGEKSPEDRVAISQMLDRMVSVIDELPKKCGTAYLLTCIGNYSRSEIADQLGVSISMIEKYVRRARHHVQTRCDRETAFAM